MSFGLSAPTERGGYRIRCPNFVDARIDVMHLAADMKTLNFRIVPLAIEVAEVARVVAEAFQADDQKLP